MASERLRSVSVFYKEMIGKTFTVTTADNTRFIGRLINITPNGRVTKFDNVRCCNSDVRFESIEVYAHLLKNVRLHNRHQANERVVQDSNIIPGSYRHGQTVGSGGRPFIADHLQLPMRDTVGIMLKDSPGALQSRPQAQQYSPFQQHQQQQLQQHRHGTQQPQYQQHYQQQYRRGTQQPQFQQQQYRRGPQQPQFQQQQYRRGPQQPQYLHQQHQQQYRRGVQQVPQLLPAVHRLCGQQQQNQMIPNQVDYMTAGGEFENQPEWVAFDERKKGDFNFDFNLRNLRRLEEKEKKQRLTPRQRKVQAELEKKVYYKPETFYDDISFVESYTMPTSLATLDNPTVARDLAADLIGASRVIENRSVGTCTQDDKELPEIVENCLQVVDDIGGGGSDRSLNMSEEHDEPELV